jgi:mannan endo-1,4-beta-mannosidase
MAAVTQARTENRITSTGNTLSERHKGSNSFYNSFAATSGQLFTINGKIRYFMGTNTYWIGFLTNDSDVDLVMSHIASVGFPAIY